MLREQGFDFTNKNNMRGEKGGGGENSTKSATFSITAIYDRQCYYWGLNFGKGQERARGLSFIDGKCRIS
jgi:hypothetical protein